MDPNRSCARFGQFTLNLRRHELLNEGTRVKLQAQPLEVLSLLVEKQGELVTREELRERLWGPDTYVDFDQGLNKAIKKIRAALEDSADEPKYIQTLARRGYRFIATISWDGHSPLTTQTDAAETTQRRATEPGALSQKLSAAPSRNKPTLRVIASTASAVAAVLLATWFLAHRQSDKSRDPAQAVLTRLTFDSGLQFGATFSPDSRFVAYSSDRGGKLDIWVQEVGGFNPHKITSLPGHNWQPDWSPNGRQIAFRSEGKNGGLFLVPAFGGPERKISSFGYRPRWSPDGTQILFESTFVPWLWNKVYLVRPDGEGTHEILSEFFRHTPLGPRSVEWYPDGKRLSIWAESAAGLAFWTVEIASARAVKSQITPHVSRQLQGISRDIGTFRWDPKGRGIYFEGECRGVRNLWKVMVDVKTLRWISLQRLTTGPGPDTDLAVSRNGDKLAFTARAERVRVWSWPLNSRSGRVSGEGEPVTLAGIDAWMPDISRDGKKLLFVTERAGKWELWERLQDENREILLIDHGGMCHEPRWSPDGARVLYNRYDPDYPVILPEGGGNEERLISSGFEAAATDWSPDRQFVIAVSGPGAHESHGSPTSSILLLPLAAAPKAEAQARLVTSTRSDGFYQMRCSPNGRWIAFELVGGDASSGGSGANQALLYVVPVSGGPWVRITDGKSWDDKPRWSTDGKLLYFMSSRTGLLNVWATRFDDVAGHPIGEPFQVTAFENPGLMMPPQNPSLLQISVAENRLVLPLAAVSGNIWMLENLGQ